jgi:hypothetical protein
MYNVQFAVMVILAFIVSVDLYQYTAIGTIHSKVHSVPIAADTCRVLHPYTNTSLCTVY